MVLKSKDKDMSKYRFSQKNDQKPLFPSLKPTSNISKLNHKQNVFQSVNLKNNTLILPLK